MTRQEFKDLLLRIEFEKEAVVQYKIAADNCPPEMAEEIHEKAAEATKNRIAVKKRLVEHFFGDNKNG